MPTYAHPPVIEAVIALHFAEPVPIKTIDRFSRDRRKQFPKADRIMLGKFSAEDNKTSFEEIGRKMTGADGVTIVVFKKEQLGYVKMAPYTNWEELLDGARKNYNLLKKMVRPNLKRVSTRFINRIDIPAPEDVGIDLPKFFNAGLNIPAEMAPDGLRNFSMSVTMSDRGTDRIVNLSAGQPEILDHVSVRLDVDVLTTDPLPTKDDELWNVVDSLRALKNEAFEACITDEARKLFG